VKALMNSRVSYIGEEFLEQSCNYQCLKENSAR
jgi:hypothetical protein